MKLPFAREHQTPFNQVMKIENFSFQLYGLNCLLALYHSSELWLPNVGSKIAGEPKMVPGREGFRQSRDLNRA